MNRYAASARCAELWRHLGLPFTRIRKKTAANRYEVGYLGHWPSNFVTIMGTGASWVAAFEQAVKESK